MNHYDVIVIGGGQAGLAIGYHLAQQGRHFTILDAAEGPAAAWRGRWDSLRLFTPARHNSLPGLPFPGDPDHYPTRDEVVAYLTDYARHFELPIEYDSPRASGPPPGRRLRGRCSTTAPTWPTRSWSRPARSRLRACPRWRPSSTRMSRSCTAAITAIPASIPAGPVLVVGGGNTGYQIAEELAATHEVHLSVGSRQTPLPQRLFGRDIFGYLAATGLMSKTRDSRIGRRLRERETLIGSSPRAAAAQAASTCTGARARPRAAASPSPTAQAWTSAR